MDEFKIGDVVKLNSGGTLMTVIDIDTISNVISCVWFTKDNHITSAKFKMGALTKNTHGSEIKKIR